MIQYFSMPSREVARGSRPRVLQSARPSKWGCLFGVLVGVALNGHIKELAGMAGTLTVNTHLSLAKRITSLLVVRALAETKNATHLPNIRVQTRVVGFVKTRSVVITRGLQEEDTLECLRATYQSETPSLWLVEVAGPQVTLLMEATAVEKVATKHQIIKAEEVAKEASIIAGGRGIGEGKGENH